VPGPAPARRLVVPGLVVPPGGTARLRVAAPGDAEAVVRFRLVGPTGDVARPAPGVVTVPAGGVAEVPLNGLAPGAYTASLEADTPVVAAAALTVAGPARGPLRTVSTEFAWTGATAPLSGDVVGAVPRPAEVRRGVLTRPPARAALVLGGSAVPVEMQLREVDAAGKALLAAPATVRVPAGRTVVVGLAAATAGYVLAVPASTPIHAALVVTLDDPAGQLLTALPVRPAVVASRVAPPAVEDPAVVGR
jgi:hypothetical protein